jgi:exodeoxyribonuclease VII small subunit
MAKKDKEISFEALYSELETTIERLEEGNLSLDEAVALYERGMELAKQCSALLDRAELRIQELTPNAAVLDENENDLFSPDDDDDEL